jgi:hypothetical protein
MDVDFLPEPSPGTLTRVDRRMANAAEHIAYHLGRIDRSSIVSSCCSGSSKRKERATDAIAVGGTRSRRCDLARGSRALPKSSA